MPGVRCPNCEKFASLETEEEPEIISDDTDGDADNGYTLNGEVRIVRTCVDCREELKEAILEFEIECPKNFDPDTWDYELEAHPTERVQSTNKKGRPIKKARYQKSFYGAEITAVFNRHGADKDEEPPTQSVTVEEQASYFEDLV